jgi:hypothetical protein
MSLRELAAANANKALKTTVLNCFALATDAEIYALCLAISEMSPASAADALVTLLGPESARVASVLPALWGPATLSDVAVATKLLMAAGAFKDKSVPNADDIKKTLEALQVPAHEAQAIHHDLEKTASSAIDFGFIGRLLGQGAIMLVQRALPELKYATRIPAFIRTIATLGGAAFGIAHERNEEERQQQALLPPASK